MYGTPNTNVEYMSESMQSLSIHRRMHYKMLKAVHGTPYPTTLVWTLYIFSMANEIETMWTFTCLLKYLVFIKIIELLFI